MKDDRALARGWGEDLLTAVGAGATAASETIEHLLAAEDAGHPSHGLRMLLSIAAAVEQGNLDPVATPIVEMTSGAVARIDGRRGLGVTGAGASPVAWPAAVRIRRAALR